VQVDQSTNQSACVLCTVTTRMALVRKGSLRFVMNIKYDEDLLYNRKILNFLWSRCCS